MLRDAELDGELPQLVQVFEQHRVRDTDPGVGQAHGVAVQVDQAEAALGVGPAQEPGDRTVLARHHQVAQDLLPGLVGPDRRDDGGGHRQRADHPALDVLQAAPAVRGQPLGEPAQAGDHRVVRQLGGDGLQQAARRVAAEHLPLGVQRDFIAAHPRLNPCHGRAPPS